MNDTVIAHAPGRICLLGDNVDLIDQAVLAAAISAYLTIRLHRRDDDRAILIGSDLGLREEFRLGEKLDLCSPLKYLKAVYARLQTYVDCGFEATVSSQIPIRAGLSSSTALCIAFIRALSQAYSIPLCTAEIAELSYVIEREDLDIECGRMDQYAIAFGGVTHIETGENPKVERLPVQALPIVVADTQEQHDTQQLQKWLRGRLRDNDRVLVDSLNRVVELVREGKEALLAGDLEKLGETMNRQQIEEYLMGTSTERLELFCRTAREAGAWGAKQMGAGGGGCTIALCPAERQEAVQASLAALEAPVWAFKVIDDPTAKPEGCEEGI